MTGARAWARGGLVVVALGLASNVVLTFVPDVVPDRAAQIIVYCMTGVIVVVAPLWVYRELAESSRRLDEERRRMRGIEAVGGDYSREGDTYEVWGAAQERVLCFGVGLTGLPGVPCLSPTRCLDPAPCLWFRRSAGRSALRDAHSSRSRSSARISA